MIKIEITIRVLRSLNFIESHLDDDCVAFKSELLLVLDAPIFTKLRELFISVEKSLKMQRRRSGRRYFAAISCA